MKYLKTYENFMDLKFKDLKEYILLKRGDSGGFDIFKISKKNFNNIEPKCKVRRIYTISNKGIKKIQDLNKTKTVDDLYIRFRFIIEYMVDHSDDIDKLLEIAELKIATKKYNI
jgi:hypothetical protein